MTKNRVTNNRTRKAYEKPKLDRQQRKLETRGRAWEHSPTLERALELKTTDPAAFAALPPSVKMSTGYYAAGKEAAAAIGRDTRPEAS